MMRKVHPKKSRLLKLSESQRLNLEEKCFDRRIAAWSNQLLIDADKPALGIWVVKKSGPFRLHCKVCAAFRSKCKFAKQGVSNARLSHLLRHQKYSSHVENAKKFAEMGGAMDAEGEVSEDAAPPPDFFKKYFGFDQTWCSYLRATEIKAGNVLPQRGLLVEDAS